MTFEELLEQQKQDTLENYTKPALSNFGELADELDDGQQDHVKDYGGDHAIAAVEDLVERLRDNQSEITEIVINDFTGSPMALAEALNSALRHATNEQRRNVWLALADELAEVISRA